MYSPRMSNIIKHITNRMVNTAVAILSSETNEKKKTIKERFYNSDVIWFLF